MSRPAPFIPVRPVFGPAEVDTGPSLVDAEAEAFPLAEVLTLPELDELAFGSVEGSAWTPVCRRPPPYRCRQPSPASRRYH